MKSSLYNEVDWKYVLREDYRTEFPVWFFRDGEDFSLTPKLFLGIVGKELVILKGYAWNGASGPTLDTDSTMGPALVHDALYQLMRMRVLPLRMRRLADAWFRDLLKEEGMLFFRRWYFFAAVRLFGRSSADPDAVKR